MSDTTPSSPPTPFITIRDTPVYFNEDWNTGIGGGLWSTGLAMAKYLQHHPDHARTNLHRLASTVSVATEQLSLLELGSGNGFLALCWLALAQDRWKELVITDTQDHLGLIQKTIAANQSWMTREPIVMEHKWGEFTRVTCSESVDNDDDDDDIRSLIRQGQYKFDIIVGSDVAYHERLYDPLIVSLQQFCHYRTLALIGVTMNDTKPLFFVKLRNAGFRYERLADHLMEPEFRGTTFGIFVIQKDTR